MTLRGRKSTKPSDEELADLVQARVNFFSDPSSTVKGVAEKYNIPYTQLYPVSLKENWEETRHYFQIQLVNQLKYEVVLSNAKQLSDLMVPHVRVSDRIMDKINRWLDLPDFVGKDDTGRPILIPRLTPKELLSLSNAALTAQRIARVAMGAENTEALNNGPFNRTLESAGRQTIDMVVHLQDLRQRRKDAQDIEVMDSDER